MENKNIFKVGDKVYDIRFGWGEVVAITADRSYPVEVDFNGGEETYTYTGQYIIEHVTPLLSLTEYTLQGFSQERPFNPQDCVGKWCLTWDNEKINNSRIINEIIEIDHSDSTFKDSDGVFWNNAKPLTEKQLKAFNLTND